MENYQTSSFCDVSNSRSFYGCLQGDEISTRDEQDQEKIEGLLGFEGRLEAGLNYGFQCNYNAKSESKKGDNDKLKKQKYAFQTRSQVDILDDGYRWRKYGQKTVKNSKFPRSYYKCTFQGCNVKKQIQRLCGDEGIVVTTYEGIHTHSTQQSAGNFNHILKHIETSLASTFSTS